MAQNPWLDGTDFNGKFPAPNAPKDNTVDTYHGQAVPDPFRPLENAKSQATQDWVDEQNKRFEAFVADESARQQSADFLTRIYDYPRESLPSRYGNYYFSSYQAGLAAQPIYQVRDTPTGAPRTLIDPNTLSTDGTVALSGVYPSPNGKLVAYFTSEAGSDAQTLHIRDVASGLDLPDTLTGLRFSGVLWDEKNGPGFQYTRPAQDGTKRMVAMHHMIADDQAKDKKIFEVAEDNSFVSPFRINKSGYEWMSVGIGTDRNNGLWVRAKGSNAKFRKLFDAKVASYDPIAEVDIQTYMITTHNAPRGKLVAFNTFAPEPKNWRTIIPEHPTDTLDSAFVHGGQLFASYSHDCADQLRVFTLGGKHKHDVQIPPQSTFGFGRINKGDKKLQVRISNFQQPGATYEYDIASNNLTLVAPSTAVETLTDCVVERIEATSKDGTKVPMTVIRNPNVKLDGTAAVKLYGYGGFNSGLGPSYSFGIVNWVRQGGIYVQANLRGGGEFGSAWYDGGRKHNKQNVFDDFAACAKELTARNYTSAPRLAIEGGSNGGLLTLATMMQYPDLFGAVVSRVPVTDMYRFDKHTHGAAWQSDYGDPTNDKKDFEVSSKYSPLHTVKAGAVYPPTLVTTGDSDDRVVPSHSYKYIATVQDLASPKTIALLRVDVRAGHGAGKPTAKAIQELADIHAFIAKSIGPIDQAAYKAALAAKQLPPAPLPPQGPNAGNGPHTPAP